MTDEFKRMCSFAQAKLQAKAVTVGDNNTATAFATSLVDHSSYTAVAEHFY